MRGRWHPVSIIFVCLATFGLIYQLYYDPLGLFTMLLIFAVVSFIFYALYRYLMKDQRKYKQNVRQRQKKPPFTQFFTSKSSPWMKKNTTTTPIRRKKASRNKPHSFTVIEGNKNKKKDPYSS